MFVLILIRVIYEKKKKEKEVTNRNSKIAKKNRGDFHMLNVKILKHIKRRFIVPSKWKHQQSTVTSN